MLISSFMNTTLLCLCMFYIGGGTHPPFITLVITGRGWAPPQPPRILLTRLERLLLPR